MRHWPAFQITLLATLVIVDPGAAQEQESEDNRIRRLGDSLVTDPSSDWIPTALETSEESDMVPMLEAARAAVANEEWFGETGAFSLYRSLLAAFPDSADAQQESNGLAGRVLDEAERWIDQGRFADAITSLRQLQSISGESQRITALRSQAQSALDLQQARGEMDRRLESRTLFGPDGAITQLSLLKSLGESDAITLLLSQQLSDLLVSEMDAALESPRPEALNAILGEIGEAESAGLATSPAVDRLFVALDAATADQRFADAQVIADSVGSFTGDTSYSRGIELMRLKRDYPIGSIVQDGERFPRLVIIDAPIRFAMGLSEVSVDQFSAFITATGFVTDAQKAGSSLTYDARSAEIERSNGVYWMHDYRGVDADPALPVIHVSHADAVAYTDWLSGQTGATYRLPTTQEYLAAAKVPDGQDNWWGNGSPDGEWENLAGERDRFTGGQRWPRPFPNYGDGHWGPAPVASFSPNGAGVYDIQGNVMEWSTDCVDGCDRRAVVGGGWNTTPDETRARTQVPTPADTASAMIGFRVVRELQL